MIGAFKPSGDLLDNPLVPGPFTLENFGDAWTDGRLGRYLLNSLIVALIITIAQLVTSVLSGYAFSMLDFPGRNVLFVLFISTMLVPFEATVVVNRRTVGTLDWINTYQGLAIPFVATAFGTFLVRQAFLGLPASFAARRASTAPATSRSCGTSPCRSCGPGRARTVRLPVCG